MASHDLSTSGSVGHPSEGARWDRRSVPKPRCDPLNETWSSGRMRTVGSEIRAEAALSPAQRVLVIRQKAHRGSGEQG